ncbi:IS30 family transposase [Rhodococcus jostii]|uniref:Transposase and inactivated derivatives, IS30 family n=1 Tax=Rhodococcus jostii TaxID=132919 RepID=A0A1H4TWJ0_RHOJO|nr:IS30 family transposase [Rhodococcus jostii]SEC60421.1 Transposase and inactivated derivatives, IS30 family [Rhodococcus jostii]
MCQPGWGQSQPSKLATHPPLRETVEKSLAERHSPEQIAGRLRLDFPDDPQMRVSTETIYQSLYQPSRGGLEHTLTRSLRTGRGLRRPSRKAGQRKNRIPDMANIADRPKEVNDRAVPGHWEGDLIIGKRNLSAIGTLVERSTGTVMLVHLPDGYKPEHTAPALTEQLETLPAILRRTLTWDQGSEMRDWKSVSAATGIDIYFCDPHAPWQRGTNENTNGILRQYFPKGSDLSAHSKADLEWVSRQPNERPRKRLDFRTPIEEMDRLLLR